MKIKYLLRIWSHLLKKSLMENLQSKRAVKTVIIISVLAGADLGYVESVGLTNIFVVYNIYLPS